MNQEQDIDKGYVCQCCNLFVKRYTRSFNANMAIALICMYRYSKGEFVKVEDLLLNRGHKRCGDFSYLRYFGLIQKKEGSREDGSSRNGFYKITTDGILFVEGKLKVKKNFLIFKNKCDGFKGEEISIREALGKAFDYNELMGYSMSIKQQPSTNAKPIYIEQPLFINV